jgi:hypothetical protein
MVHLRDDNLKTFYVLIGECAGGQRAYIGSFDGEPKSAYEIAVHQANWVIKDGRWDYARVYIMAPEDYCCELRDGKPTMVKHHMGEA